MKIIFQFTIKIKPLKIYFDIVIFYKTRYKHLVTQFIMYIIEARTYMYRSTFLHHLSTADEIVLTKLRAVQAITVTLELGRLGIDSMTIEEKTD